MRLAITLALMMGAMPVQAQGLLELNAAYFRLQAVEKMCLYIIGNIWNSPVPVISKHVVPFTPLEGGE